MTIHLFILQSLLCAALYTTVKLGGGPSNERISYAALRSQTEFLSQLFRTEFIFPTEGLESNIATTIADLERENVISVSRDDEGKVAYVALSDAERETGRENFDFYCFLIWPFIEAAWLGAVSLAMLTPPRGHAAALDTGTHRPAWLDHKAFTDRAQLFGKTLYHQGDLSYFEAVNKETLKNALSRFQEEGIVIVTTPSKDSKVPPRIRLAEDWVPGRCEGNGDLVTEGSRLWAFAEMISASRREGKNRRDGGTVKRRVLGLADLCGRELWEGGKVVVDGGEEAAAEGIAKKDGGKRRKSLVGAARL